MAVIGPTPFKFTPQLNHATVFGEIKLFPEILVNRTRDDRMSSVGEKNQ